MADETQRARNADKPSFMKRRRMLGSSQDEDPMASMGNLFDIAILMGVGLLIMAMTSFGLGDLMSNKDTTIVKNPGKPNMEIITRKGGKITRLQQTGQQAEGQGMPVGTVYRLQTGEMVWMPDKAGE